METFKKGLKISELLQGTTFELNSNSNDAELEDDIDGMFWADEDNANMYRNPCETSFENWKLEMVEISDGVFKKILSAGNDTKKVDLKRTRVTYHRNMYIEGDEHPFDSTYLNGKSDEVCLALHRGNYLEGFIEALASMTEGEQSLFVISYKKMFKELGCGLRIKGKADILCDLKVVKVEVVGDDEAIEKLLNAEQASKNFTDIKEVAEETRARASDYFSQKRWVQAIKLYQRILQIVDLSETTSEKEVADKKDFQIRIHTNLAICFNKKEEWPAAMSHIRLLEELSSIDNQPKILYAKGRALMMLGENQKSLDAFKKAIKLRPLDTQISQAIENLKKRMNSYEDFQKTFAKNLKLQ